MLGFRGWTWLENTGRLGNRRVQETDSSWEPGARRIPGIIIDSCSSELKGKEPVTGKSVKPDIEVSNWIASSPGDIWNYLLDVSKETNWREGVVEAQWVSDQPYGVGSKGLHIIENIGDWPWTVTELEEQRVISWVVTGGRFEGSHAGYRISPEGTGCTVTIHVRMELGGLMKILKPIMKPRIKGQLTGDLVRLKAIMEG